jgi:hypothetical protein
MAQNDLNMANSLIGSLQFVDFVWAKLPNKE